MKGTRYLITAILAGGLLMFAAEAKADAKISVSFGGRKGFHHERRQVTVYRHPGYRNSGFYPRGYVYYYETRPVNNSAYLPLTAIVDMAENGLPDDAIINEIRRTGSTYNLTSQVIAYLKQNNVSDKVINFMLATD